MVNFLKFIGAVSVFAIGMIVVILGLFYAFEKEIGVLAIFIAFILCMRFALQPEPSVKTFFAFVLTVVASTFWSGSAVRATTEGIPLEESIFVVAMFNTVAAVVVSLITGLNWLTTEPKERRGTGITVGMALLITTAMWWLRYFVQF